MIRTIDLRGQARPGPAGYAALLPRAAFDVTSARQVVDGVCADVADRGDEAVLEYCERFDGVRPPALRVPAEVLARAEAALDPELRAAITESIRRLRITCAAERETDVVTDLGAGAQVRRRIVPIGRVGLYVPGGRAPLASSVYMNAVPAQVAGVGSMTVASPPQREFGGWPHPTILAVCHLLGIDEVYAMGGAQAIAALACGLPGAGCAPVDLITGPGNIYVVAAKRWALGRVAIDSEAGPTEVAVLADETADAGFVAADLVSQAEHAPDAAAVLVTTSPELADGVAGELERQVAEAKHGDRIGEALAGQQSAIVLVDDLDTGVAVVDAYAAEHLEIQTRDAAAVASRVTRAGVVFVGPYAPVSLGDYVAGSNHVLPTGGAAARASGLSVRHFTTTMQVVEYDAAALAEVSAHAVALAEAEDLPSHGAAVSIRGTRP